MATVTAPASNADLLDNPPRGLVFGVFCVVIVLQYVYVFSFNWSPELRLPLSSALAAVHVALAAFTLLLRPAAWNLMLLLSAGLMVATLIPSHAMGLGEVRGFDAAEAVRKLILPLMFIWMLAYPLALPRRLLVACATIAALVGAAIAVTGEPVIVSGTPRLASITGTLNQMHPSAKFITMQLILFDLFRRAGFVRPWFSWSMIALCGAVLLGYGARSQQLLVVVYYLMIIYWRFRRETIVQITPFIAIILALFASYVLLYMIPDVVNQWGSGRIGHWQHRIELLLQRNLSTALFGGGIGSDIVWSEQWDYSSEGFSAHNDYIYFFTEHGLVGLAIMLLTLFALWRRSGDAGRALVVAILISSFFDNGYLRNLLNAVFLGLAFSVALVATLRQQNTFGQAAQ
jgi:hypothetical protein